MKTINQKSAEQENTFYGMRGMLNMFQQVPKMGTNPSKPSLFNYFNEAYKECDTVDKKQLFYSLMFSFGDIANRNHNIFQQSGMKNIDDGGNSMRKVFIYSLEWMLTHNCETQNQFYEFLPLISEYTNIENLFFYQLKTDRWKGTVQEVIKLPIEINKVTNYIAAQISSAKTSDMMHTLWAKFLSLPNANYRKRRIVIDEKNQKKYSKALNKEFNIGEVIELKKETQKETQEKEQFKHSFAFNLSKKLNWEVKHYKGKNTKYIGLEEYKKKYLSMSEAHLFSSKNILLFEKEQFINWVNEQPSGSRYRIQKRLLNKIDDKFVPTQKWLNTKGENLGDWFLEWEERKIAAQKKLLSLTEEDKKKMTKKEVREVEKAAKVSTAGETLISTLAKMKRGSQSIEQTKAIAQTVFDKIKLEVPVLMFVDVSGSMSWGNTSIEGVNFSPRELSAIALTAFLMKNPQSELRSMFGVFSTNMDIISDWGYKKTTRRNAYLAPENASIEKTKSIIDKTKHFYDNYLEITKIISSFSFGSTNVEEITTSLKAWVDSDARTKNIKIEQIQQYPVHLFISDGEFNSSYSPSQSLLNYRRNMKQWFGWEGLTVIWDCKAESYDDGRKFEGIENTMYFGSVNPTVLNQIFTNIDDLDIVDVYLPLQAMAKTNRYELVRNAVINPNKVEKISKRKIKREII